MVSPNSLSSERTRSVGSEEVPQPKTSEELAKELTLSEEILEQVVAHVGGTVVDATDIPLPPSPVKDVRPEVEKKISEEKSKGVDVTFPDFLQDSVVPLLKYLDGKKEKYVVSKEIVFYVELRWDKKYVEELAEVEAQRAEEVRVAEELRGKIAEAKTAEEDLHSKIAEIAESRRRMEKAKENYRHLQDETTDELRLRVEKCLRGFAMWGLQTVKWLKLDSLKRRLMSIKANGSAGQKHIVEIVKTFLEGFDEACQNVELEIKRFA
ncbi:hypothetical protein AXG93_3102s1640 [Marchantia polymorpha subsp. ruderalis]|uniref:Uncharacterized protein n=1 Tax=Marchantia polymorpha subsp. ruderalis TaxID=1480154 RepID=A0A176W8E0_MARPO|nr:hypothetical protein AXG93_3102s1640 [Marchantia polymorpha subsp. ruderalis]